MASGNINLRDPALYRIKHVEHQNTGNEWPIYPMYDYAHSLSDAVEGITHSLCTLEFEITARCTTGAWTRSTWRIRRSWCSR
jgi:glutaminyl-tRNA synthetase